jgi:hypothetical protein
LGIILLHPLLVIATGDIFHPLLIVEIPLHGLADAGFEGLGGFPAEFAVDCGDIYGVAAVMAGGIRKELKALLHKSLLLRHHLQS